MLEVLKKKGFDFFGCLLFLYFITLHADRLSVGLLGSNIRINNVLALFLLAMVVARFRFQLVPISKKLIQPLLWITLSLALSCLFSPYKSRCIVFVGWFSFTVICYLLIPYLLVKMWDPKQVFSLYCLSFFCVGGYAGLQLVFSILGFNDPFAEQVIAGKIVRPNALCFEPSYYALYMTPFVFLYNYHYLMGFEEPFFIFKKKSLALLVIVNLLYVASTSTSVFFAYFIFLFLILCVQKLSLKTLKFALSLAACALLLFCLAPFLFKQFFLKFFFLGFMAHHSFFERFVGIQNAWHIFWEHPFFGVGLGAYPNYLMEAFLRGDNSFLYLQLSHMNPEKNPLKYFEAMNVLTELMASLGIGGLLSFGLLFVNYFSEAKKAFIHNKTLVHSLWISFVVTVIVLQFNQGLFRTYIWVHLGLTFGYFEVLKSGAFSLRLPDCKFQKV